MNMIKSTLKLTFILYLCVAISGVYVFTASARITPKDTVDDTETTLITIKKGDTLWDLCQEHLKDPTRWRELSKYNDFTDPHWIYPGEKLRIPVAMMENIKEEVEDKVEIDQEELEKLQSELAESEGARKKLMAEIEDLKGNTKKLEDQIKELEKSLKSQDETLEAIKKANSDSTADLTKVIRNSRNALQKNIEEVKGQLEKSDEMLATLQKDLKAAQDSINALQGDVKTALANIEANQKALSELQMMIKDAQGVHEEVSTVKRSLVVITTVAAGIGWFVLNAIGGRSGE